MGKEKNTLLSVKKSNTDIKVPVRIHWFDSYELAAKFMYLCDNDCIMTYEYGDNEYLVQEILITEVK